MYRNINVFREFDNMTTLQNDINMLSLRLMIAIALAFHHVFINRLVWTSSLLGQFCNIQGRMVVLIIMPVYPQKSTKYFQA